MKTNFDINIFRTKEEQPITNTIKKYKKFIPAIPWNWITKVAKLKGKALNVAIVIYYLYMVKKSIEFKLSNKILKEFGVNRNSKAKALKILEINKIINVVHEKGNSPTIKLLVIEEIIDDKA